MLKCRKSVTEGGQVKRRNRAGTVILSVTFWLSTNAMADGDMKYIEAHESPSSTVSSKPKRVLNGNMTLHYGVLPESADTVGELFSKGIFYGRLRMNSFYWHWTDPVYPNHAPKEMGVGGSLIYKSASLDHFSFTVGGYASLNPAFFRSPASEVKYAKAGKDTFSRYKVATGGGFGLYVLGQGYLEYHNDTVDLKGGRQLFESVFTKSNDTKMIPNTFDGVSGAVKIAPKTTIRAAWFGAQKLRDHAHSHDVITFKDGSGSAYGKWNNNDDSGGHKGLTYDHFIKAGKSPDHSMYVADIQSKSVKHLKAALSYLQIPGVLKDAVLEAHYTIPLAGTGWAARPGIRYYYQMDDGGAKVAGDTNFLGKPAVENGYNTHVPDSLDSSLFNARLDILMPEKKGFFRLGYSKVADKADIIAPWRGFPTGGFTRAMAQYNWRANTQTWMIRAVYKFNSVWKASIRYAVENFDDNKDYVLSDGNVIHIDTWTNMTKELQMRIRYGHVSADKSTPMMHHPGKMKPDWSYDEFRLEFNYLF